MAQVDMKWYVLRAVGGKEAKVKEYIDAEINNGRLGGNVAQVLIPTEKVRVQHGNKTVVKERNYLPGYVLVEANMVGEIAHDLRNTPNVMGFLGGLNNPTPLHQDEVDRILGKFDEMPTEASEIQITYEVGDNVKVIDGPFASFNGVVEEVNNEKKLMTVSVKVFGRNTPLSLGFMQVEKQ